MNPRNFFAELKRRNVYKVAVAYAVVGWLVMQVAATVVPALHLPDVITSAVVVLTLLGFPIALVLAWAFEMTPEGLKRTENVSPEEVIPQWSRRKFAALIISLALAAAGLLAFQFLRSKSGTSPNPASSTPAPAMTTPAPAIPEKSIAVLAFTNLSDDKENEYFSDGISDELGNVLGRVPGLRVSGRNSAFYFKGKNATAQEIGQKLGVAYLVTGSVRKLAGQVRITAQLINTADGFQVWSSEPLTRELKDIFGLQDEIAGLIAQNLKLKLSDTLRAAKTVNPEAHRLVLEGRHFWNLRTQEGFTRAEAAYTKALEIDPQFAEAHAGQADNYQIRAQYRLLDGLGGEAEDQKRALVEVQTAIRLDPELPEAYAAYAYLLHNQGKLAEADQYYQKVFALNPNYAIAHLWHGQLLDELGRLDAAVEENRLACELDPLGFIILDRYAQHLAMVRRFEEALAVNERAAALRTDVWMPNLGERALVLVALGRANEAIEVARSVRQNSSSWPRWTADADAVWVLRRCGLPQEADEYATQLLQTLAEKSYVRGFVLANAGRFAEALPYLERLPVVFRRNLFWSQNWDEWRDDPRFPQLLAKLGCADEYKVARQTLSRMLRERATSK
jgi:TolB-like protein/Tfp pilus assembly protein PilF